MREDDDEVVERSKDEEGADDDYSEYSEKGLTQPAAVHRWSGGRDGRFRSPKTFLPLAKPSPAQRQPLFCHQLSTGSGEYLWPVGQSSRV